MAGDVAEFILRLIDKLSGPSRKATASIDKLDSKLGGVGKTANRSSSFMRDAFSHAVGGAIQSTIGTVLDLGKEIGSAGIEFADFAQRSELAFGLLAKHGASPIKLFEHARGLAETFGLDVQDTTKQFQKFLALQFNPKQATDLIAMGSDMQALGASSEETKRIFAQLGQIKAKGRLQGEELVVLAENGLSTQLVMESLAKKTGKSMAQVQKALSKGQIGADDAFFAIGEAIKKKTGEKEFGDAGAKFAETTIGGMWGVFKARGQNMMTDVGKAIAPVLFETFGSAFDAFDDVTKGGGPTDLLIDGFTAVAGVVKDAIPFVKAFIGGFVDGFKDAWPALKGATDILFEGFGSGATWQENVKTFATTLGKVVAFGITLAEVFGGAVVAGLQLTGLAVDAVVTGWNGMVNGIGAAIFAVDDFLSNLGARWERLKTDALEAGANLVRGLVDGITSGVGWVVEAATNLGGSVMTALKSKLGIASPSKEFEWLGEMSALGFSEGLQGMEMGPLVSSLAMPPANLNGQAGGMGGGITINQTNNFYVTATDPKEASNEIKQMLTGQLADAFERLADEAAA